jgi:GTP-binding protein
MLPIIAIVGRPNVGKSTLFNVLTRSRDALVADQPGLTRDRRFGAGHVGPCPYVIVDTGGLHDESEIGELITKQAMQAVENADVVLFLTDARDGLTVVDEEIAQRLRQFNIPVYLVINKAEQQNKMIAGADFQSLGFEHWQAISAAHREGVEALMESVLDPFAEAANAEVEMAEEDDAIRVAVIGRPNVGKSTLVNRMLGEERQLTYDMPGTTRDSIDIPFTRHGQKYCLIDTAGIRRRAKVAEAIEKFSVIKALEAMERAQVVIFVMDAREGMTDQDSNLLGHALDSGRALIIVINKWDGMSTDDRDSAKYSLSRKLHFIDFTRPYFISALHGSGVGLLFGMIQDVWRAASTQIPTAEVNQILMQALEANPPPYVRGRRIKLRYAHQGGINPPLFVIHGNQTDAMPDSYKRYLINSFRKAFKLQGTPIKIRFKQGDNPFKGKKNKLTPGQVKKRKRMMKFVKRR